MTVDPSRREHRPMAARQDEVRLSDEAKARLQAERIHNARVHEARMDQADEPAEPAATPEQGTRPTPGTAEPLA